ncbi:hypothetical protein HD597_004618 [Nonomuraea thailandensis]|uniref:Uncharacterized protein n=1 Tax=Nonomuraea thailandensis TaxID=1188745 RepID=A0A9X2GNL1_9ACTN|nr:hypothetical protein [Nonomuraea thailandensis]MCP2357598.1 hypothetical protein [Nonomuraea thailandensis]
MGEQRHGGGLGGQQGLDAPGRLDLAGGVGAADGHPADLVDGQVGQRVEGVADEQHAAAVHAQQHAHVTGRVAGGGQQDDAAVAEVVLAVGERAEGAGVEGREGEVVLDQAEGVRVEHAVVPVPAVQHHLGPGRLRSPPAWSSWTWVRNTVPTCAAS